MSHSHPYQLCHRAVTQSIRNLNEHKTSLHAIQQEIPYMPLFLDLNCERGIHNIFIWNVISDVISTLFWTCKTLK